MKTNPSQGAPQAGQLLNGFRVTKVTPMPELRLVAYQAIHEYSGARLLHLHCPEDAENLFAIGFRTPPTDDCGTPHILEHSVLCGSRKFPVKDPFVEMLKMSMATFINAITYPDRTIFPVASNVRQDFFNLADVYTDAVFHPDLSPMTLKQEGHHFDFARSGDPETPLVIKGIVYNEMRGAYSDLDSLIDRYSQRGLFPDSIYGLDSGGDPEAIPDLGYEQFKSYYEQYYHPSNSYILVYGDIGTADQTSFLDVRLRECPPARTLDTAIAPQKLWAAPREVRHSYPIDRRDSTARKSAVTLNWIVGHVDDPIKDMGMEVLERLLLGNAGAPLRKALVDSKLGEDLSDSGYSNGSMENTFHVGLKGTDPERKDEIVNLILNVLKERAEKGFSSEQVEMAFQQLQYAHREIQSMYPLRLMSWVYNAWIYDLDPLTFLRAGCHLDELYRRCKENSGFFSELIRTALLDNPHRLTGVFVPEPGLQQQRDQALTARLASRKEAFSAADLARLAAEATELEAAQSKPNTPEAIATLPQLQLRDLPARPKRIPAQVTQLDEAVSLLTTDVFANGVNYLTLAFSLSGLPHDLWDYVPLFCYTFTRLGTGRQDYAALSERIAGHSGGISASTFAASDALDPTRSVTCISIHGKALDRNFSTMTGIVQDILTGLDYADQSRLKDVLLQLRVRQQSGVIPSGHHFAASHAGRGLSPLAALEERWGGLPQVRLAGLLAGDFDSHVESLCLKLARIRDFLLSSPRLLVGFTGTPHLRDTAAGWLQSMTAQFSLGSLQSGPDLPIWQSASGLHEGLAMPADVAFCASCMPAPHLSSPESLPLQLFSQLLTFDYLWDRIRVKGGAYGAQSSYSAGAGLFSLLSYRDPEIAGTLKVYQEVLQYAERTHWSAQEIERAVISCAKEDEKPIRPAMALAKSMARHLTRLSDEVRDARRQALLAVDADAVKAAAVAQFRTNLSKANFCTLASREALEEASAAMSRPLTIENVIL